MWLPGDADAGADGQPLEAPADVGWRLLELLFDGTSPLAEVGPAFVVDGDGGAGADPAAQLDGLPGGHAVAHLAR